MVEANKSDDMYKQIAAGIYGAFGDYHNAQNVGDDDRFVQIMRKVAKAERDRLRELAKEKGFLSVEDNEQALESQP